MALNAGTTPPSRMMQSGEAERLNRGCFCIKLDRHALADALDREVGLPGFAAALERSHPTLFSNTPVFIPAGVIAQMTEVVSAMEAAAGLSGYREAALSWAAPVAFRDFGPHGALMGYDFHVPARGPKLIEINTNAGGAFLNAALARAQEACCASTMTQSLKISDFESRIAEMFLKEWRRQRGSRHPRWIVILDDAPQAQHLLAVIESGRVDLSAMVTHRFKLDNIEAAYDLFANQRDGVFKVAITP